MIPLWIKVSYTLWAAVLLPVYWHQYGPSNFLWFSDVAFFGTLLALWRESQLLASVMALSVALPELMWSVSFFGRLLFDREVIGLADYMFDSTIPLFVRGLSFFHFFMPLLLIWMLHRFGYDRRALLLQTLLAWIILPASYFAAGPEENINWVYGLADDRQAWMPDAAWVALLMLFFPVVIYTPSHLVFRKLFPVRTPRH